AESRDQAFVGCLCGILAPALAKLPEQYQGPTFSTPSRPAGSARKIRKFLRGHGALLAPQRWNEDRFKGQIDTLGECRSRNNHEYQPLFDKRNKEPRKRSRHPAMVQHNTVL